MGQDIRRDLLTINQDEDYKLVKKLVERGTPSYIIRDHLIDRGHSAAFSNRLILYVRREVEAKDQYSNQVEALAVGVILLLVAIAIVLYFILPALSNGS